MVTGSVTVEFPCFLGIHEKLVLDLPQMHQTFLLDDMSFAYNLYIPAYTQATLGYYNACYQYKCYQSTAILQMFSKEAILSPMFLIHSRFNPQKWNPWIQCLCIII